MPAAIPIAASVAGAAVSSSMNKGASSGSQTTDRSPWEPAQPFMQDLIKDGQSLYSNYQQNPFSDAQKTAYQNQFTMNDMFNNELMPALGKGLSGLLGPQFGDIGGILSGGLQKRNQGLLGSASQSQNYSPEQLQGAGQFIKSNIENPGMIQQEASRLGLSNADVLRAAQTQDPNIRMNQVNQFMGRQDPQYAKSSYGLLDFSQYSPWTNGTMTPASMAQAQALAAETPAQRTQREQEEYLRWLMLQGAGDGSGDGGGGGGVGAGGNAGASGAGAAGAAAGAGAGTSSA